jgi:hypothetical protein
MANPEHFAIISTGANKWNRWREEHPDVVPDFSNQDFSFEFGVCPDFTGINLSRANLTSAVFIGSDRDWPNETCPTLDRADLSGAVLDGAWLFRTSFNKANLVGASFRGTDISSVHFIEANLKEVDLAELKSRVSISIMRISSGPSSTPPPC